MTGILAIESLWSGNTDSKRASVQPFVEFVARSYGVKHTTFTCGTREELAWRLKHSKKSGYGILYIASHGIKGALQFESGDISIHTVAQMMGLRFHQWSVHFGGCSVLRVSEDEAYRFKRAASVKQVSGWKTDIDWAAGAAIEMVWLSLLVSGKKDERKDWTLFSKLAKKIGFVSL